MKLLSPLPCLFFVIPHSRTELTACTSLPRHTQEKDTSLFSLVFLTICSGLTTHPLPGTPTGKGYIVKEELRDLCSSLAIADEDSDVIFTDLDRDMDGKISYTEFSKGFIEFLNRDAEEKTDKRAANG